MRCETGFKKDIYKHNKKTNDASPVENMVTTEDTAEKRASSTHTHDKCVSFKFYLCCLMHFMSTIARLLCAVGSFHPLSLPLFQSFIFRLPSLYIAKRKNYFSASLHAAARSIIACILIVYLPNYPHF